MKPLRLLVGTGPRDVGRWDILVSVLTNPSFPLAASTAGSSPNSPHRGERYPN